MKNKKLLFMIFTSVCFVAAGTCLIVDIVLNNQITWAAYALLSIPFGWVALLPLFAKKHRIILVLCALTLLTLPYLFLISKVTPVTDWFMPVGLPSAIGGMIAFWILFALFRFAKINIWYKSAITVFLLGVILDAPIGYFVDIYLGIEPFKWNRWLGIFACVVASVLLGIMGYRKSKPVGNQ